jgi:uncharacterized protein with GYD domain
MPIYVTLGNWTDQGTKDFGGAVQRANGFREMVEQAGGRAPGVGLDHGRVRLHHRGGGTDDETAATLVLRVGAAGTCAARPCGPLTPTR